jgi:hypothetical protein
MFGYHLFGEAREPTRFEKCEELKQIGGILAALRKKENELSKAKQGKGAGTVDFDKHTVVSKLVRDLDQEIEQFNTQPPHEQHEDEIRDMIQLVSTLENIVKISMLRHQETLNKFRNSQHEIVANTVDWGLFLGSMTALYMAPFGLLFKFGVYVCGMKPLRESVMEYSGLSAEEARSMIILKGMKKTLHDVYVNLRRTIHEEFADDDALRRLARGNREKQESGLLFLLSPSTQAYVDDMRHQETNTKLLAELNLTDEEEDRFRDFLCPVGYQVMDVPVRLEENHYFELENLLKLNVDKNGARENPFNRNKFYPRDIQPARAKNLEIKALIEQVKAERKAAQEAHQEQASGSPRPSN